MKRIALSCSLALLLASCVAGPEVAASNVCEEAALVVASCDGSTPQDFGSCTPELAAESEQILEYGCAVAGKSDVLSQLCIGPLKKHLPWCQAETIACEASGRDLNHEVCNGSEALCARRYDEVVYATSHNAFSVATLDFLRPNQSKRMYRQLKDGMRALMIDSRRHNGEIALCHLTCELGMQDFVEGLQEVRDFLECYPNEVVTLIIEPHAPGSEHVDAIIEAGLDDFVYTHTPGEPWPYLGEMIDNNQRLVVLAEQRGDNTPDWYHYQWDFGFDTEYAVEHVDDFACDVKRGDSENDLFGLNHFITKLGGDEFLAIDANQRQSIIEHADICQEEFGRVPNFIAVDFHDIGDVMGAVDRLNNRR